MCSQRGVTRSPSPRRPEELAGVRRQSGRLFAGRRQMKVAGRDGENWISRTLFSMTSRPIATLTPVGSGATTARTVAARHPFTTTSTFAVGPHRRPPTLGLPVHALGPPIVPATRAASRGETTVFADAVVTSVQTVSRPCHPRCERGRAGHHGGASCFVSGRDGRALTRSTFVNRLDGHRALARRAQRFLQRAETPLPYGHGFEGSSTDHVQEFGHATAIGFRRLACCTKSGPRKPNLKPSR